MAIATSSVSDVGHAAALVVGSFAGLLAIAGAARGWWRRTLGRRRASYARLARLRPGLLVAFFEEALGQAPAMRTPIIKHDYLIENQTRLISRRFEVSTFIDDDYCVQAISDANKTIVAFSVTTRSRWFRPVYEVPPRPGLIERWRWRRRVGEPYRPLVRLKLGRTTFSDLDPLDPTQFSGPHLLISVDSHEYAYSEISCWGSPEDCPWFVWTASDAVGHGRVGNGFAVKQEIQGEEWPDPKNTEIAPCWDEMAETQRFRRDTVITTYTVVQHSLDLINYPLRRFGPHENDLSLFPLYRIGFSARGFYLR